MKLVQRNVAYIDGANLHNGIKSLSWNFDYKRFRVWLREKYAVEQTYLFIGMMPKYAGLYTRLQEQRTGVKIYYIADQETILRSLK